jgi:hypothetical protein
VWWSVQSYAVDLLWKAVQDEAEARPETLKLAIEKIPKMVSDAVLRTGRGFYVQNCVMAVEQGRSTLQSLQLLRGIVDCAYRIDVDVNDRAERMQLLQHSLAGEKKLIALVLSDLVAYQEKVLPMMKGANAKDVQRAVLSGRFSHGENIKGRLEFVAWLVREADLLTDERLLYFWDALFKHAYAESDRDYYLDWLYRGAQRMAQSYRCQWRVDWRRC